MALIVHFVPKGLTETTYRETMKRLAERGAAEPRGRLHHTCYGDRQALEVVDVYDTPENFEAFGRVLMPVLAELGVDPGRPEIREVHNIVRG